MNRIAELRDKVGLSQTEFGKLFNAAQNTVSNWENGNRECPLSVLVKMADFFTEKLGYNVTTDYILGRDIQNEKPATISDDGLYNQIYNIVSQLSPENREKLLELAGLYLTSQNKNRES